jgi:hypothetical protein
MKGDINRAIYNLNMIQGNTDFHIKVLKAATFTVTSGAPIFAQIKALPNFITLTVTFSYEGYIGELTVFTSTIHKLPDKKNCQ